MEEDLKVIVKDIYPEDAFYSTRDVLIGTVLIINQMFQKTHDVKGVGGLFTATEDIYTGNKLYIRKNQNLSFLSIEISTINQQQI